MHYYQNKTILVTGAAGFIGSHLVHSLLQAGAKVIGVDNFISSETSNKNLQDVLDHQNFNFEFGDAASDPHLYLPQGVKIDAIFHFASPASPPIYQKYPVETYLVNSLGTHHLAFWLKKHNPQGRLLFASTSEVYGNPLEHPQKESYWGNVNPNGVRSCYDESKRMGETVCGVFYRDFGLDTRLVRIFNTYGPSMNPNDGRIIPQFIQQAQENIPLTVYGDGSQTRSYCYVDDLVRGLLLFMAKDELKGETINLGNPEEYTVLETARIFNELAGRDKDMIEFRPLPSDDPVKRKPDISKAKKLLGWEPEVAFREGLTRCLE
ncbi:GDP-mannose 4,6-dehydratase [Microgenomates group bacterium]|nr:GDP-mannose 4,6-dehydratase [Microgenomates group bacterium]